MDDSRWERIAAGMGIVFVALLLAATFVAPAAPKTDEPTSKFITYATDHRSALLIGNYLAALGVFFAFTFLGAMRSYFRRAEGGTGRLSAVLFGGGVAAGVIALLASAVGNAVLLHAAREGDPAVVRALYDLLGGFFTLIWIPVAVWVGAASVITMRTNAFPKWYGQVGALFTVYFLVAAYGVSLDSGPLANGGALQLVAFALFALWVLATSILLMQRLGTTQPMTEASVTG
jgi:hypothetical protein